MPKLDISYLLDNMLNPVSESFTNETARRLLELRAEPKYQNRLDELADKNTQGTITPQELSEYQAYVSAGQLIATLQAKARNRLVQEQAA